MRKHLAVAAVLVTLFVVGCTNGESTEPPPPEEPDVTTDAATPDPTTTVIATTTTTLGVGTDLQALADAAAVGDPGAVFLAVGQDGELRSTASGTTGDGETVDPSMAWEGASLAKMIVATAVMQLVDQGLLDLDAPVSHYVDFDVIDEITVRDVLRHGSGIPNLTAQLSVCPTVETIESTKAAAGASTGPTEPGEYSNTNYILLAYMVGELTDTDIGAYTRENIFTPLTMTSTYWWETQAGPPPYWRLPSDQPGPVSPFSCPDIEQTVGTEGLTFVTSLHDMDNFLRGLFGGKLVSLESLDEMLPDENQEVGLGVWAIDDDTSGSRLYGHFGGRGNFSAQAFFEPELGKSVVVYGTDIDTEGLLWDALGASPPSNGATTSGATGSAEFHGRLFAVDSNGPPDATHRVVQQTATGDWIPIDGLAFKFRPAITANESSILVVSPGADVGSVWPACEAAVGPATQDVERRHKGRAAMASRDMSKRYTENDLRSWTVNLVARDVEFRSVWPSGADLLRVGCAVESRPDSDVILSRHRSQGGDTPVEVHRDAWAEH